ncbi:rhodanese-like domain-containing protein [Bacillus sp. FJAT-45350]|uniref:rhodanese-like domain-containing protein n=1 Tax=Bacillus sp. FJAT-45350 TaxID=2011014 RepID=UPI00211C4F21|nr:rhodanese-like domain-containing protein [Bacillus sp. FJAT-45350]
MKKISPESFYKSMENQEKILLLDVRAEEKYKKFHIKGSTIENLNIPKTTIFDLEHDSEGSINDLAKDREVIVTCTTGNSATRCASILSQRDYKVSVLEGGITAWKEYCKDRE